MARRSSDSIKSHLITESIAEAFKKLHPRTMSKNPVIFVTWVGASLTTFIMLKSAIGGAFSSFELQVSIWLWFTILFANFAEALAEGRSKAQALGLKKGKSELYACQIVGGAQKKVLATSLRVSDIVICQSGDVIPADGEVIEGIASVDESAITGESAPVIRESGGYRSAVTGGTKVISDRIVIRVSADPGNTFLDRIISLIENAKRQKTPNEIALTIVLTAFSIIMLLAVTTLKFFVDYAAPYSSPDLAVVTVPVLVSLLVCLIPTTIGGLLSAIGIAGMDRLIRKNIIAKSGRAIEASGDIGILMIDKTGTITLGNRVAVAFIPAHGVLEEEVAKAAQLASLSDETPEGRSIVVLAKEKFHLRAEAIHPREARFIAFSAETKISGVDLLNHDSSHGSLLRSGDRVVGSSLIGQKFSQEKYFWPRPSASDYEALPAFGSNLGPLSKVLADTIEKRRTQLALAHAISPDALPHDLLTASGSGLDPHISYASALMQVHRVAKARKLDEKKIEELMAIQIEGSKFALLGQKLVNILMFNLSLDAVLPYDQ